MSAMAIETDRNPSIRRINTAPPTLDPRIHLPRGFMDFVLPLHQELTQRQQALVTKRAEVLDASHAGSKPNYLQPSAATTGNWKIQIPAWCADQRNQMTGPADDAELVVKMLNSGAPGVMLDLEDSMANEWPNLMQGIENILAAITGEVSYFDLKRNRTVGV